MTGLATRLLKPSPETMKANPAHSLDGASASVFHFRGHLTTSARLFAYCLLTLICGLGCQRGRDETSYFAKSIDCLDHYLNTNAPSAEAAMLELERFTQDCEKVGSQGIDFNEYYAALYSRLYLLSHKLGKHENASRYYGLAAARWLKEYRRRGFPDPTEEKIRDQIEGVDRYFGEVEWKKEK